MKLPLAIRKHIDKTSSPYGCWLWIGNGRNNGYGKVTYKRKTWRVHKLVWVLLRGPVPVGQQVLHNCPGGDNKLCCRPTHLWIGNHKQNMADMVAKGRQAIGDRSGRRLHPERYTCVGALHPFRTHPEIHVRGECVNTAKLTEKDVRVIRQLFICSNVPLSVLAKRYDVAWNTVWSIATYRTWKHVLDTEATDRYKKARQKETKQ